MWPHQCKCLNLQTDPCPLVGVDFQKLRGKHIFLRHVIDIKLPLLWMVDLFINWVMHVIPSCIFNSKKDKHYQWCLWDLVLLLTSSGRAQKSFLLENQARA